MQKQQKSKKDNSPNKYLRFTSVAFQMCGTILLGSYFGKWLDATYNTNYWTQLITLFSVFVAMYLVISQVIKISKEDD